MLTYKQILDWLCKIEKKNPEQLDYTATVRTFDDEFLEVVLTDIQYPLDKCEEGLTYKQILFGLRQEPPENLNQTMYVQTTDDEWITVVGTAVQVGNDVLDDGHPYLVAFAPYILDNT